MKSEKPFVITIVGAESSGKTRLATILSSYFGCPWLPEYAREYLSDLNRPYKEDDLLLIAQEEVERITSMLHHSSPENFIPGPLSTSDQIHNNAIQSVNSIIKNKFENIQPPIIIVDGGLLTIKMWSRIKYGNEIPLVESALKDDVTDLYLLCRPRAEWEPDAFREAPSILERAWIYNQYLAELVKGHIPFEIVTNS